MESVEAYETLVKAQGENIVILHVHLHIKSRDFARFFDEDQKRRLINNLIER